MAEFVCRRCGSEHSNVFGTCPRCSGTETSRPNARPDPWEGQVLLGRYRIRSRLREQGAFAIYGGEELATGAGLELMRVLPQFATRHDLAQHLLAEAKRYGSGSAQSGQHAATRFLELRPDERNDLFLAVAPGFPRLSVPVDDFMAELVRSTTAQDVLQVLASTALRQLRAEHAAVFTVDDGGERGPTATAHREAPTGELGFSRTFINAVLRSSAPIVSRDLILDPRFSASESIIAWGIRSAVGASVGVNGSASAVVLCDSRERTGLFEDADVERLARLAQQAGDRLDALKAQTGPVPDERTDPGLDVPPGSVEFGRYRLLSKLGHGGMAETWKAVMLGAAGVSKTVVIKRILPHLASDPEFITSFINEAKVTATLSHGNLAQVFDFGELEGEHYLVIEYVHGRTLEQLIERTAELGLGTFPAQLATFVTIEVLKGLQYAHSRTTEDGKPLGIVHRDVSPDNILIGFDGQAKLVDFGVAKSRIQGRTETQPGLVKGKWQYFSPEQARGEVLDGRSDLFATGIVLYRLLSNCLPFKGDSVQAMRAIAQGAFPPLPTVNPAIAPQLAQIVACALEHDRTRRFSEASKMEGALRHYQTAAFPDVSSSTLGHFMRWAFADELKREGLDLKISEKARREFESWRAKANAARGAMMASLETRPVRVRRSSLARTAPWAGLFLAGAIAGALWWLLR